MVKTIALSRRALVVISAAMLAVVGLSPLLNFQKASAAQLTTRSVTIDSSQAGKSGVSWAFNYTPISGDQEEGLMFEFCTTPLGGCTQPTGMDVSAATISAQSYSTPFTALAAPGTGDCVLAGDNTDTKFCATRTEPAAETASTPQTFTVGNITNPTLPGAGAASYSTVYVRISIYNNSAFTPGTGGANIVHYGVVAAAITQQLTTQGRVQERLEFCVAAVDDGTNTDTSLPTSCSAAPTTTTVDLGVIDNSSIVKTPVDADPTKGSNDYYGIAMVNTNAAGGVVVAYYPEADTSVANSDVDQLRSFRVANADCQDNTTAVFTDQCFENAAGTGSTFVAGTEMFGLYVPCVDSAITTDATATGPPNAASAARSTTSNLVIDANYRGDYPSATTSAADCENQADATFAWNNSGNAVALASSTSVVDDEIVKLSFGATASATTPTGLYRVTTTYIATPTF